MARTKSTPGERSLIAQLAALEKHAQCNALESTAAARAAGPGSDEYWLRKVDPDGNLAETDRRRRAAAAKKAFYVRLALQSAKARRAAS